MSRLTNFDSFNLSPGRILAKKYEVVSLLGSGWEGEVYLIREIATRDTLILASDGLFDNLYVDEIVNIIRKGKLEQVAQQLVTLSHARMTTQQGEQPCHPDDLSFILYRKP